MVTLRELFSHRVKKVKMQTDTSQRVEAQTKSVGFWEAFWFWVKLGFINFGGPAGQIAIMHRELVEKKRWVSEGQYLRTLNFCMLLPGPEAQQVATYIGWRLHGTLGGIVAGSFFVIPQSSYCGSSLTWRWPTPTCRRSRGCSTGFSLW